MAEATVPEEIILLILSWLPVKSLLRFSCISQRFQSIILSDPQFAKSQFQASRDRRTLTHRILSVSWPSTASSPDPRLQSLDLETPSFGDYSLSVRELRLPFPPPHYFVRLLGSCNGIAFLAFGDKIIYMWNPLTRFFKKLPDPCLSPHENALAYYGVGYLPATEDYKLFVLCAEVEADESKKVVLYSSRADAWETLEVDTVPIANFLGILLKDALHWLDRENGIMAFDLAQEEGHKFRKMLLPRKLEDDDTARSCLYGNRIGISAGGCLSLAHMTGVQAIEWLDVWVMGEYGVCDSWKKVFNLKFLSDPPYQKNDWNYDYSLVLESKVVAEVLVYNGIHSEELLVNIHRKEEDKSSLLKIDCGHPILMVYYQESLLRIDY